MRREGVVLAATLLCATSLLAQSGALPPPVIDDDEYTTYRQISWADFLDRAERAEDLDAEVQTRRLPDGVTEVTTTRVSAWLYSVVQIDEVDIVSAPIDDGRSRGRWQARPQRWRVYALMDKRASGFAEGTADAWTLAHEQGHFDLAELCARRFSHEVGQLQVTARSANAAQRKLLDLMTARHKELGRRFRLMQQRYDGETDHAQKERAQKRWRRNLDRWLRQKVPDTCTG